ncbi:MAG TPA: hypothetical protein VE084_21065, partial [Burkholderiaceae bacterium]|nr:hypothetical protein [Burkholderiaceae bacterium]
MKQQQQGIARALAGAALALLAACGGGGGGHGPVFPVTGGAGGAGGTPGAGAGGSAPEPAPAVVKVDDLGAGIYAVSTGDPDQPTLGRYYAGPDGKRLLALEDAGETVDRILRRADDSSAWVAVPAPTADLNVQLLRSQASATAATPDVAALAGRYVVRLSGGTAADFRIDAQGRIA